MYKYKTGMLPGRLEPWMDRPVALAEIHSADVSLAIRDSGVSARYDV